MWGLLLSFCLSFKLLGVGDLQCKGVVKDELEEFYDWLIINGSFRGAYKGNIIVPSLV